MNWLVKSIYKNLKFIVMTKVKNNLNVSDFPSMLGCNSLPSLTIPDQAMSIKEIIRRFASGLPVTGQREELYDYDEKGDPVSGAPLDIRRMDLAEVEDELASVRERIAQERARQEEEKGRAGREQDALRREKAAQEDAFWKDVAYRRKMERALKEGSERPTE